MRMDHLGHGPPKNLSGWATMYLEKVGPPKILRQVLFLSGAFCTSNRCMS
jgi:hypothetical protein